MKNKFLLCTMFLLIIAGIYVPACYSQTPTYTCTLANDVQTATNVYEFDVYILRTGTNAFELAGFQIGLTYNASALNGGTLTATWVDASTDAIYTAKNEQPSTTAPYTSGIIRAASFEPPSHGNGTIIPNTASGARYGRLRLTNSISFASQRLSVNWAFSTYPSRVSTYVAGINTDITDQTEFINTLGDAVLPVELNSFISNVSGRQVNLSWSTQTEVNSNKYEIERALVSTKDATVTWASIGIIQAAGSSNSPKKYSFTDKNLQAGKYQYRLKMIDNGGSYKFSDIIETEIALPKDFALSQNYPNPFNPTTKIDYQVPVDSRVILEVYSITGKKVVELVNQEQQAGYYSVNFGSSSSKLASGVYIYRIVATEKASGNNYSSIKKMMLLK